MTSSSTSASSPIATDIPPIAASSVTLAPTLDVKSPVIPPQVLEKGHDGEQWLALGQTGIFTGLIVTRGEADALLLIVYEDVPLSPFTQEGVDQGWIIILRRARSELQEFTEESSAKSESSGDTPTEPVTTDASSPPSSLSTKSNV
jgi:hypothetical protein